MHRYIRKSIGVLAALQLGALPVYAHEGEVHAETPSAAPTAVAGMQGDVLTTSGTSDYFEVVAKYSVTDAGEDTRIRLFIADFATNRPIADAGLSLAFKPAGVTVRQAAKMVAAGIYDVVVRFPTDDTYALVLTATAGQRTDFVEVQNIHAGTAAERFLAEQATTTATPPQVDDGMSTLEIAAIGAGIIALTITAVVIVRRRRNGVVTSGAVSRDHELAIEPSPTKEQ